MQNVVWQCLAEISKACPDKHVWEKVFLNCWTPCPGRLSQSDDSLPISASEDVLLDSDMLLTCLVVRCSTSLILALHKWLLLKVFVNLVSPVLKHVTGIKLKVSICCIFLRKKTQNNLISQFQQLMLSLLVQFGVEIIDKYLHSLLTFYKASQLF